MIFDPFDGTQAITPSGKTAAQVYLMSAGSSPLADLSEATFLGFADPDDLLGQGDDNPEIERP